MTRVADPAPPRTWPLAARLVAIPVTAVFLLGGLLLFGGVIAPDYTTSIVFGAVWMILAAVVLGKLVKPVPGLRWFVRGTVIVVSLAVVAWVASSSLVDDEVHERLATGVKASEVASARPTAPAVEGRPAAPRRQNVERASGRFRALTHGGASGRAQIVQLASGGTRLNLDDLSVDNGPDLRVYLVAGDPTSDGEVSDFKDLGPLKGNKGDQSYRVPRKVDAERYDTVYVWCRAFTVGFARAPLRAS